MCLAYNLVLGELEGVFTGEDLDPLKSVVAIN